VIPVEKHGEVIGQLDKRLFNLENDNTFSAWEKWFGKHPMVVVGIVITALCAGFWGFYAWTIDRLDRTHREQVSYLEKKYKGNLDWMKEQHNVSLNALRERCSFETDKLEDRLRVCKSPQNPTVPKKSVEAKVD